MGSGGSNNSGSLFTALGHPLRRRILRKMIAAGGEISPLELADQLDEPLSALSYHVRVLADCRAVRLARTKQVRGTTQHFYRATVKAEWARAALARTSDPPAGARQREKRKG